MKDSLLKKSSPPKKIKGGVEFELAPQWESNSAEDAKEDIETSSLFSRAPQPKVLFLVFGLIGMVI